VTEFVKLKTDSYKGVTKGRYYEVSDKYLDPIDGSWSYMIRLDNMIEYGLHPQGDFEKPITHARCINNEGSESVLTTNKTYEIVSINYIGGELVALRNDVGQIGQYSSKRFEFVEKSDGVNYTHAICKNNETVEHKLTYGGMYEIAESNNSMIKIVDDNDEYSWFAIVRFELVTEDTLDTPCKREEPKIMLGGIGEKLLKPLRHDFYHITYSLQYAEGVELADINKSNIIQIEGKIVSKGRVWVIETNKGTVIIPFKAIIHMHPQY
jgi:hypothetical protein